MIIISQDKREIVNFDNIAHIFISKDSENHYLIEYGKMTGTSELLGVYKTEERAKEVLQQIIDYYNREDFRDEKMDIEKAKVMIMIRDKSAFYMPEK